MNEDDSMDMLNIALTHFEDFDILSQPTGAVKRYMTPKAYWGLSLNLLSINAALAVSNLSVNGGVSVWWETSWDGVNWFKAGAAVISEKTTNGQYRGEYGVQSDFGPLGRLVVEIRQPVSPTAQQSATISLRAKYRMDK
jgi:hypothetical protein